MSNLIPGWIENAGMQDVAMLRQAICIAWTALYELKEFPDTWEGGSPGRIAEDAMTRIEELSK